MAQAGDVMQQLPQSASGVSRLSPAAVDAKGSSQSQQVRHKGPSDTHHPDSTSVRWLVFNMRGRGSKCHDWRVDTHTFYFVMVIFLFLTDQVKENCEISGA